MSSNTKYGPIQDIIADFLQENLGIRFKSWEIAGATGLDMDQSRSGAKRLADRKQVPFKEGKAGEYSAVYLHPEHGKLSPRRKDQVLDSLGVKGEERDIVWKKLKEEATVLPYQPCEFWALKRN